MKTTEDRFFEKVVAGPNNCWIWTASTAKGYGKFWADGKCWGAHHWLYVQTKGAVPEGLDLDHLCRERRCVNTDHLEPVTRAENLRRGIKGGHKLRTHCVSGRHPFTEESMCPDGKRRCIPCRRERQAGYRVALKQRRVS